MISRCSQNEQTLHVSGTGRHIDKSNEQRLRSLAPVQISIWVRHHKSNGVAVSNGMKKVQHWSKKTSSYLQSLPFRQCQYLHRCALQRDIDELTATITAWIFKCESQTIAVGIILRPGCRIWERIERLLNSIKGNIGLQWVRRNIFVRVNLRMRWRIPNEGRKEWNYLYHAFTVCSTYFSGWSCGRNSQYFIHVGSRCHGTDAIPTEKLLTAPSVGSERGRDR